MKIVCNVRKFPNQLGTGLNAGFRKVAREGILTTLENGDSSAHASSAPTAKKMKANARIVGCPVGGTKLASKNLGGECGSKGRQSSRHPHENEVLSVSTGRVVWVLAPGPRTQQATAAPAHRARKCAREKKLHR